jgi:serine/threonine-protein kinase HipA
MSPRNAALRLDTSRPRLRVTFHEAPAGTIGESEDSVWFRYDPGVAAPEDRRPDERDAISVRLPVSETPYGHSATLVFFDNLLLESDTRAEIAQIDRRDASDVTGLLGRVGAECAGAVSIWPMASTIPDTPAYRALTVADIERIFDERHGELLPAALLESRQMMSGVQRKLVVRWHAGAWHLPLSGAPSTHLIKRASGRYDGLVANELACLRLFAALGLPVPSATPLGALVPDENGHPEPRLLAIERFDRVVEHAGAAEAPDAPWPHVTRWHQEDLCQITGRRPTAKYQQNGGPTLRDLAQVIRRYSATAATDLQHALTAAVANVCLGNGDAHGKNFALQTTPDGIRRLAPFYDVVSTDVYPSLTPSFSMRFGYANGAHELSPRDLQRLASDFTVAPALVGETIARVCSTLPAVIDGVLESVERDIGVESPVLSRLRHLVFARVARLEGGR